MRTSGREGERGISYSSRIFSTINWRESIIIIFFVVFNKAADGTQDRLEGFLDARKAMAQRGGGGGAGGGIGHDICAVVPVRAGHIRTRHSLFGRHVLGQR